MKLVQERHTDVHKNERPYLIRSLLFADQSSMSIDRADTDRPSEAGLHLLSAYHSIGNPCLICLSSQYPGMLADYP